MILWLIFLMVEEEFMIVISKYQKLNKISLVNNIGDSGQSIQLTWQLVDELDDICQTRNGQVNDGDSMMWQTLYFNTYMLHELRIVMDDGQDLITVNHSVSILYDN